MSTPPAIKLPVATNDGTWREDKPRIEWPDVHPPAYRVPNPINTPPPTASRNPRRVSRLSAENNISGIGADVGTIPKLPRYSRRSACMITSSSGARTVPDRRPPRIRPTTKNRFHRSIRQSYAKYGNRFPGSTAAQMCLNEEDTPNDLLPIRSSIGTVRPIMGPDIYQGHGFDRISSI